MDTAALQAFASQTASQYGVDPGVFLWQLGQESAWNNNASATDPRTGIVARGIAQFQPATAAQYGVDVSDPFSSIVGAAKFDSTLLSKNGGDYLKMLKSYGTLNSNVPQSIWDKAKSAIAGAGGPASSDIGQNCGWTDFNCLMRKIAPNLTASDPGHFQEDKNGACAWNDIPCWVAKFGQNILGIIIGLIFIAGGIYLIKE